jgi:hypothetical protein
VPPSFAAFASKHRAGHILGVKEADDQAKRPQGRAMVLHDVAHLGRPDLGEP